MTDEQRNEQRDETLSAHDQRLVDSVVLPQSFESDEYDDAETGDWGDEEDDDTIEVDGVDDPDVDLSDDDYFTEDVDYGEAEDLGE